MVLTRVREKLYAREFHPGAKPQGQSWRQQLTGRRGRESSRLDKHGVSDELQLEDDAGEGEVGGEIEDGHGGRRMIEMNERSDRLMDHRAPAHEHGTQMGGRRIAAQIGA